MHNENLNDFVSADAAEETVTQAAEHCPEKSETGVGCHQAERQNVINVAQLAAGIISAKAYSLNGIYFYLKASMFAQVTAAMQGLSEREQQIVGAAALLRHPVHSVSGLIHRTDFCPEQQTVDFLRNFLFVGWLAAGVDKDFIASVSELADFNFFENHELTPLQLCLRDALNFAEKTEPTLIQNSLSDNLFDSVESRGGLALLETMFPELKGAIQEKLKNASQDESE